MKVAFLDRDGTIVKDYPDKQWTDIQSPEFLSLSIEALANIQQKGYSIIVITNQYIIGEGFITHAQYRNFTEQMLNSLSVAGINIMEVLYCPHSRKDKCRSTKPNPGMIEEAMKKYPNIDLAKSFLVGDSIVDAQLAQYFNLKYFGIQIGTQYENHTLVNSLYEVSLLV